MIQSGEQLAAGNCSSIQWLCLLYYGRFFCLYHCGWLISFGVRSAAGVGSFVHRNDCRIDQFAV